MAHCEDGTADIQAQAFDRGRVGTSFTANLGRKDNSRILYKLYKFNASSYRINYSV